MRWAWIRPGGPRWPDLDKARAWGFERLVWDSNDPQIDSALLKDVRYRGCGVGISRAPDWYGDNATQFAERLSDDLTRLGFGPATGPASCAAVLNREQPHDPADQLAMLKRWRELRPTRLSAWAVEPNQGGWIGNFDLSNFLANDPNLEVLGELYFGTPRMYPVSERRVIDDLIDNGVRRDRAKAYYDGERTVPWGWNGMIFDFAKLPAKPLVGL